jgi:hypothetical protein
VYRTRFMGGLNEPNVPDALRAFCRKPRASIGPTRHRTRSRVRMAARVAIRIAINDRPFVETSQAPRHVDACGTRPLGTTLARVAAQVRDLNEWMNAMPTHPNNPQDDVAGESPIAAAGGNRRANIESPVDTDQGTDVESPTRGAHTPRPHPPVEEPEEEPNEHAPETEPESDPDSDSDQRKRPPRPGKAPR